MGRELAEKYPSAREVFECAARALGYHRDAAGAEETRRLVAALGARAAAGQADVADPAQVEDMVAQGLALYPGIDILGNNAGVTKDNLFLRMSEEDWHAVMAVNLDGMFHVTRAVIKTMVRQRRGRIINISSLGGIQAWPGYMHYCSSKAANIMLTRCLAKALAPHIQVNSVAPGTILFADEVRTAAIKKIIAATPLKKAGNAHDIAQMVLYLVSRADFITGQVFVVDGGKSIA